MLCEAEEKAKELRITTREVAYLRAQLARLAALLSEAGARSSEAALVKPLINSLWLAKSATKAPPPGSCTRSIDP